MDKVFLNSRCYGEAVDAYEADASGTPFDGIADLAVTPSGEVYTIGGTPAVINLYDSSWGLKQTITTEIDAYDFDIAYDPVNELLYLATGDRDATQIVTYNADGEVENEFSIAMTSAEPNYSQFASITVDAEGNIVFGFGGESREVGNIDLASGAIQVYQADGILVRQLDLRFVEQEVRTTAGTEIFHYYPLPYGLTVDSAGRIYAYEVLRTPGEGNNSGVITSGIATITAPNGALLREFAVSQEDSPVGATMALSPDESLMYVTTANFVHIISLTEEPPFTTVQLAENGRLRAAPVDGTVVDSLTAGAILIVTGQNEAGDWLQVRHNGTEAWVAAFLTEPVAR
jgi:hypothetical protein